MTDDEFIQKMLAFDENDLSELPTFAAHFDQQPVLALLPFMSRIIDASSAAGEDGRRCLQQLNRALSHNDVFNGAMARYHIHRVLKTLKYATFSYETNIVEDLPRIFEEEAAATEADSSPGKAIGLRFTARTALDRHMDAVARLWEEPHE